jgi:hypothetical protein
MERVEFSVVDGWGEPVQLESKGRPDNMNQKNSRLNTPLWLQQRMETLLLMPPPTLRKVRAQL